ncbi:MAG: DMT family transporter [Alcaligenaceae bacterium]|nr:DMT family transporter [Alcaligenaceae bacterium]
MADVQHRQARVPLGVACIMAGVLCLTISDGLAKWLGDTYSPVQLLFLRGLLATPVLVVLILALSGPAALRTQHLGVHLLRGLMNVMAASCFYLSLTLLPLAEATAIAFSAPLLVTIISVAFLGEKVSLGAWIALLAGFAGVLLIVRPSPQHMQWAAVLPLITALGYAVMMVSARRLNVRENMLTTTLYIALGQVVFTGVPLAWVWEPVQTAHLVGFIGLAIFSTLGLGLITQAFRVAPASIVAPFDYSGLIWATLLGWLVWSEAPSVWFYAGAFLIASSGVYIALSQRKSQKKTRSAA